MANSVGAKGAEVTFITPGGSIEIRLTEHSTGAICRAAKDLGARFFVTRDGWDDMHACPIWGVFDMRTAQRDTPVRGEWSINDPIRTFLTDTSDAAVMYAIAIGAK